MPFNGKKNNLKKLNNHSVSFHFEIFSYFNTFISALQLTWLILTLSFSACGSEPTSGRNEEKIKQAVACEGEKVKLKCIKSSTVLLFHAGYYGRIQTGRVVCTAREGMRQKDDVMCSRVDVSLELRRICEGRTRCRFKVDDAIFGNTCPNVYKYLSVIYTCVPRLRKRKRKKGSRTDKPISGVTPSSVTPFTSGGNISTNVSVTSSIKVIMTVVTSSSNDRGKAFGNATYGTDSSKTVSTRQNISAVNILPTNRKIVLKTTAQNTYSYSTTASARAPSVLSKRKSPDTSLLGSLVVLAMHIAANTYDYVPVLLLSVGSSIGFSLLVGVGCICVNRIRRKDHLLLEKTVKLERVNGYQYKKNLPSPGEDSLPRSLKESLCGSTSSLEKKWPPPPEMCLLDSEDCEPRPSGFRDGLATLPKTTNTNNKNLDRCRSPGSEVEYVIVQKRDGSKLYLNPMPSFQSETLLRNDPKASRVADQENITTAEPKNLWNGGLGWSEINEPLAESRETVM